MKKRNKLILFLLTTVFIINNFIIQTPALSAAGRSISSMKDVPVEAWYYKYVKQLYEKGILNGTTDTTFSPDSKVKYCEVFAIIVRYLGLETEAKKRQTDMTAKLVTGASLWYSGYMQILYELGILIENDVNINFIKKNDERLIKIEDDIKSEVEKPITRMEAIMYVTRSFEMNNNKIKAKNFLWDVSGNGNEFILGGGYDRDSMQKIIPLITDYNLIPDIYKDNIVKCYYNGIISGDENGNINPSNNLKRSEFSKIIAAILFNEYRSGNDYRDLPSVCIIKPEDYYTSSITKKQVLKKERAENIIEEYLKGLSAEKEGGNVKINFNIKNIVPKNFIIETYFYKYSGEAAVCTAKINGAVSGDIMYPKYLSYQFTAERDNIGYVLTVLRDQKNNGEICGEYMVIVSKEAVLQKRKLY